MGSFSIWHWLIVLVVVLVLFGGGGKISRLMGDFGRGLKSFKKNIKEDEAGSEGDPQKIADNAMAGAAEPSTADKEKAARGRIPAVLQVTGREVRYRLARALRSRGRDSDMDSAVCGKRGSLRFDL